MIGSLRKHVAVLLTCPTRQRSVASQRIDIGVHDVVADSRWTCSVASQ